MLLSVAPPAGLFTPQQIRAAYGIDSISAGSVVGDGTGQTVAIVDVGDNPHFVSRDSSSDVNDDTAFLASDLHQFDEAFGLPEPPGFFTKIDQNGNSPSQMGTAGYWADEEAEDVEWVHAIAPGAKILLVEAYNVDNGAIPFDNLEAAIDTARKADGVSVVSLSWDFHEVQFPNCDSLLTTPILPAPEKHPNVTFVVAAGDQGASPVNGPMYPGCSPNVVSVGGTSLYTDATGDYASETGWNYNADDDYGGGGGFSGAQGSKPIYQQGLVIHNGANVIDQGENRAYPDVALDADPDTGVAEYNSFNAPSPWEVADGTSLATPCWAGLVAIADQLRDSQWDGALGTLDGPSQTLPALYAIYHDSTRYATDFHDITTGYNGYSAATGYDLITGIGSPIANELVPDLALSNAPDLAPTVIHSGNFTQGDVGDSYSITVSNVDTCPTDPTTSTGAVSLTESLPAGLVATAFYGDGWTTDLATLTATRSDPLAAGASYPALTLTVDVANDAPASVTNTVTVAGGNEGQTDNDVATDPTTITATGGTVCTWIGAGTDNNWSTAANWSGNAVPAAGDRLFFAGTTRTSSVNDLAADTVFDSLTFENGGFSISGNAVELDPQHGAAIDSSAGENTISLPVTLEEDSRFLIEGGAGLSFGAGTEIDTNGHLLTIESANAAAAASVWLGEVEGTGGLMKTGAGAVTLSGQNSYAGDTTVDQGALVLAGGDDRLPVGTSVTLGDDDGNSGVLQLGDGSGPCNQEIAGLVCDGVGSGNRVVGGNSDAGTLTLDVPNGKAPAFYGVLGGSGQYEDFLKVIKSGSGTQKLYSLSTYNGGTILENGTLYACSNDALGIGIGDTPATDGAITLEGGTLRSPNNANVTLSNPIAAAGATQIRAGAALTLSGNITGSGTISFPSNSGILNLNGNNEGFSGTFSQSGSSTILGNANAGSGQATWQIDDGVLIAGVSGTINLGALSGNDGDVQSNSANGPVTFAIGGNNRSTEFDGVIEDVSSSVALTKVGAGRLTLGGANTYTGVTTIQSGTLYIKNPTAVNTILSSNASSGVNNIDGFLILGYTADNDPVNTVVSLLAAAYNASFQTGQIRDTSATASIGLGWVDRTATFQIIVMPALYGDANLNGQVTAADLGALLANFNGTGTYNWSQGDFNYSTTVTAADLGKLMANYNQTGPLNINNAP
jgi:autotransporter-associated beta strand protein